MLLILWFFFAITVAAVFGAARTIGFWPSLLWSIFLSPLIGLIITLSYETTERAEERRKQNLFNQTQTTALRNNAANVSMELERLHLLKEKGAITEDEYLKAKSKLLL